MQTNNFMNRLWRRAKETIPHGTESPTVGKGLPPDVAKMVADHFDAQYYLKVNTDVREAGIDPLAHYLRYGWEEGRAPNSWFDAAAYQKHVAGDGTNPFVHLAAEAVAASKTARQHYAATLQTTFERTQGNPAQVDASDTVKITVAIPAKDVMEQAATEFDPEYYLARNPDVAKSGVDPLVHFMTIGWIEGRDPSADFSVTYYLHHNHDIRKPGINPFTHHLKTRSQQRWRRFATVEVAKVLRRFEPGGDMEHYVREAMEMDPMVGFPRSARNITSPLIALKDVTDSVRALRQHMQGRTFDYIIAIPHIRMSGAARVAAIFTKVLAQVVDPSRILVVVTDSQEVPFAHWFPANVARLDLVEYLDGLQDRHKTDVLNDVMRGVQCNTFVNINSRLAWEALTIYGRQLSQEYRLITYLFTWDETPEGLRGGYPIQWLRNTADYHHILLTDTRNLADDICERLGFDEGRVRNLYTPVKSSDILATRPSREMPPRVLWAGRFDRQKRVDLLVAVARANPDIMFDVYGKAVLDSRELADFDPPSNIVAKGTYEYLSDVLRTPYHGFLYTAQWDGLPTILLDMAQAKVPIIAPRVGGIAEVITSETGWLVEDFTDVTAMNAALREIIAQPDEAARRSEALFKLVNETLSEPNYRKVIEEVVHDNAD